jgi:hypothetical protein
LGDGKGWNTSGFGLILEQQFCDFFVMIGAAKRGVVTNL